MMFMNEPMPIEMHMTALIKFSESTPFEFKSLRDALMNQKKAYQKYLIRNREAEYMIHVTKQRVGLDSGYITTEVKVFGIVVYKCKI